MCDPVGSHHVGSDLKIIKLAPSAYTNKVNQVKCRAILEMKSPMIVKEV